MDERDLVATYLSSPSNDIEALRQNSLQKEGDFIRFVSGRGISVSGVITGDPSFFMDHGLLKCDGMDHASKPMFHPFRIVPLRELIEVSTLHLSRASFATEQDISENLPLHMKLVANTEKLKKAADLWNEIVDLAIILEPLY